MTREEAIQWLKERDKKPFLAPKHLGDKWIWIRYVRGHESELPYPIEQDWPQFDSEEAAMEWAIRFVMNQPSVQEKATAFANQYFDEHYLHVEVNNGQFLDLLIDGYKAGFLAAEKEFR